MKQSVLDLLESGSFITPITVGATAVVVAAPSVDRVSLIFSAPVAGRITYSPNPDVVDGAGIVLAAGASPLKLSAAIDGDLCRRAWYGIADAGGRLAGVAQCMRRFT